MQKFNKKETKAKIKSKPKMTKDIKKELKIARTKDSRGRKEKNVQQYEEETN